MTDVRDRAVEFARSLVGLTHPDPRYLDLIDPNDDPARQRDIGTLSGCALVAHGILREVLELPEPGPYVIGRAIADLLDVARAADAIRSPAVRPQPGDIVHVGAPSEHVYMVVETDVDAAGRGTMYCVRSVDGGQRDPQGHETIDDRVRAIEYTATQALDHGGATRRPVLHVLDLEAMARHYGEREESA